MRTSLTLTPLAVLAGCLLSGCSIDVAGAGVTVTEEKSFAVTGRPDLTLRTGDGSMEIRSWDQNEVRVEILRRAATREEAQALEVKTSQDGNRITIEAPPRQERRIHIGTWVGESVSFIVRVPRQLLLNAQTGDGSITVGDLEGTVALRSGDGSIRGERVQGDLSARTGDGSITLVEAVGRLDLDTGDGSVRLHGRPDVLRVRTGDGSVTLDLDEGSKMAADWSLTTGDGSIRATLPAGFSAEVDLSTGDGSVRVNGSSASRDDGEDRGRLRTRLGAGGHTLTGRSGDGSINLSTR